MTGGATPIRYSPKTTQVSEWTADIAVTLVPFRRGRHGHGQACQPAPADPPDKRHIFHQLQARESPDRQIKVAVDQQALVAIGKPQPAAAPCHHRLEAAGGGGGIVQRKPAVAGAVPIARFAHEGLQDLRPARFRDAVRVQEEQPVRSQFLDRRIGAGTQLQPAPSGGGDQRGRHAVQRSVRCRRSNRHLQPRPANRRLRRPVQ